MNIRDVNQSTPRTDALQRDVVGGTGRMDRSSSDIDKVERVMPIPKDRVEISDAARAASEDTKAREVNLARKALLGIPPLSIDRAQDLLMRITEGYYSQPDILKAVSIGVSADILGKIDERA
jgi:hypothetical protein